MAGVCQFFLCNMVLFHQGVQYAGVSLAKGQADLAEIGLKQMLARFFRADQQLAYFIWFNHNSGFLSMDPAAPALVRPVVSI